MEPFGVPTGSMAPTFFGNHKAPPALVARIPFALANQAIRSRTTRKCTVPIAGLQTLPVSLAPEIAGDRLLVDKNVFASVNRGVGK